MNQISKWYKIEEHLKKYQKTYEYSLVSFLIIPLFIYLDSFRSIIPWFICYGLIGIISNILSKKIADLNNFKSIVKFSYIILSILGLIITVDNVNNFGLPYGDGHDDSEFFYNMKILAEGTSGRTEYGLYIFIGSLFARFTNFIFFFKDVSIIDLLPLNWVMAALCIGLSGQLAYTVLSRKLPNSLLFLTLIGNFVFVDSTVRLYRDVFMLFFVLLSMILILKKKYIKGLFSTMLAGIIRGADGLLTLFFLGLHSITSKVNKKHVNKIYIIIIISLLVFSLNINQRGSIFIALCSRSAESTKYYQVFEGFSISDIAKLRMDKIYNRERGFMASLSQQYGGIIGFFIKLIIFLFFPITFYSPVMSMKFNTFYDSGYVLNGFFIFNIIKWLMVLCWIIIIPLFIIGFIKAIKGTITEKNFVMLYLISLILIILISGQFRHTAFLVVLNPVFINIGFNAISKNHKYLKIFKILKISIFILIIFYNIFKIIKLT